MIVVSVVLMIASGAGFGWTLTNVEGPWKLAIAGIYAANFLISAIFLARDA